MVFLLKLQKEAFGDVLPGFTGDLTALPDPLAEFKGSASLQGRDERWEERALPPVSGSATSFMCLIKQDNSYLLARISIPCHIIS